MSVLSSIVGSQAEQAAVSESQARREACEKDFYLFCKTYLSHWFTSDPATYQRLVTDLISAGRVTEDQVNALRPFVSKESYEDLLQPTSQLQGILDAEPRGFGKSARALALLLWWAVYKIKKFSVFFGASQDLAASMITDLKEELEDNELIVEDFGELKGKIWRSDRLTLKNGCSIMARGAGARTRGIKNKANRPDAAIIDDIMTDDIADSKKQRDKVYRWFKRVVIPLGRDIFLLVINTMLHEDDLMSRLFGELREGKLDGWVGLRFAARQRDGASLWPEYWTEEKLRKKELSAGSAAWSTEYMNEPLSSEDAIIKRVHYYDEDGKLPDFLIRASGSAKRYGGIDPATGVHDKCSFVTLHDQDDGRLYVVNSWGERLDEAGFLDKIIDTYELWRHNSIGFEDVAFQGIYKNNLIEKAAKRKVWLPIFGRSTKGMSKVARVRKMAPSIEAGFILFSKFQKELVTQLTMFTPAGPKSAYDDEADGLWYAYEEAQAARTGDTPVASATRKIGRAIKTTAEAVLNSLRR